MTPEERKHVRITARMDQRRASADDFGRKVAVSEIELLALCSLAHYGLFRAFEELGVPDQALCRARATAILDNIKTFDLTPTPGVNTPMLILVCAAILRGERLAVYTAGWEDEE